jgi:hypothetical protein
MYINICNDDRELEELLDGCNLYRKYIYVYKYMYMYLFLYTSKHIYTYLYIYVYMYINMYVMMLENWKNF